MLYSGTSSASSVCFNRTFMELKYWKKDYYTSIRPFQSYLYGIEITILNLLIRQLTVFQSYLYGIEIFLLGRFIVVLA